MTKYQITQKQNPDKYIIEIKRNKNKNGGYTPFEDLSIVSEIDKEYSSSVEGRLSILRKTALHTLESYLYEQALKGIKEKIKDENTDIDNKVQYVKDIVDNILEEVKTLNEEVKV